MNYQTRAFQISFLLHSVIIALVIICSTFMGQYQKMVVVDFDLLKPVHEVKKVVELASTPVIETRLINPTARQIMKKQEPPQMSEKDSRMSLVPEAPPVVKLPEAANLESRSRGMEVPDPGKALKEGSPGIVGGTKERSAMNSGTGIAEDNNESAKAKYLNDHFAYIRDKILKNVSYPDTARRKGWQGKVLLSFIITANGSVRALKILQSSGFNVLDKTAIETVRDSAPFPKPLSEAQLVIPIIYHLE